MHRCSHDDHEEPPITLDRVEIPPDEPPTPEEIARRTAVVKRMTAFRNRVGPIGIASDDLVHLARSDCEPE